MSPLPDPLHELRISDVMTFFSVRRHGSLTGAAGELGVTPSQVSKAITRLESQLNRKLLSRSSRGAALSDAAERLVPHLEVVLSQLRMIRRDEEDVARELTVAAPSYLISALVPPLAQALAGVRLRALQLAPAVIQASASLNVFDIALSIQKPGASRLWQTEQVGLLHKSLFANPALAGRLGRKLTVASLREVPFISPMYSFNGQYVPVDDGCPLPYSNRRLGHEAQTIGVALELAVRTDQVVFGPEIAAHQHLRQRSLVRVAVEGWDVSDPLYVLCNIDRVAAKVQRTVVDTIREVLQALSPGVQGSRRR